MPNTKSPNEERAIVVRQASKRPYGVRVSVHLQTAASIGDVHSVCLPLHTGAVVTIEPRKKAPWDGGEKFLVTLEGFPTATAAEAGGRRIVQALLWTAVSLDFALRLEYSTYEPAAVFDRTLSSGVSVEGFGASGRPASHILQELGDAYSQLADPEANVLLSMEILAGASLEASQRARFLAIVSALEPLAEERPLGQEVNEFVDSCVALLNEDTRIGGPGASLRGRLGKLRNESIRQAILRLVRETLPHRPNAPAIIDQAYAVRSEIVHTGRPADLDVELEQLGHQVGHVIREMYAVRLHRKLVVGVPLVG